MNTPTHSRDRSPTAASLLVFVTVLTACSTATTQTSHPSPSLPPASASPSQVAAPTAEAAEDVDEEQQLAVVVADEPLVLRSAPGTASDSSILEARLHQSMTVRVLDGPVSRSGYDWYRVATGTVEGWAAAGTRDGEPYEPWLARMTNGLIAVGDDGQSTAGVPQVFLVDADGADRGQLTHFTPDDLAVMTGHHGDIVLAVSCGTGVDPMTWSPTGEALALAIGSCDRVIHVVNADGSSQSRVADGTSLAWSPDGERLAMSSNVPYMPQGCADGGPWEMRIIDLSSGVEHSISRSESCLVASLPAWSPDGHTIAFNVIDTEQSAADGGSVSLVDLETGGERHLTHGWRPQWSPDGSRLLVQRVDDTNGADPGCGECTGSLVSVAVDGSGEVPWGPGYGGAWSPGGEYVGLWRPVPGREAEEVVISRADGSATELSAIDGVFRGWSPDGRHVLISRNTELWRYPLRGDEPVLLTERLSGAVAWQPVVVPMEAEDQR